MSNSEDERPYDKCYGCNCLLPYTKTPKLCQGCRYADEDKKARPRQWMGSYKRAKIDPIKCAACRGTFKNELEYEEHCCKEIVRSVNETLDTFAWESEIPVTILKNAVNQWVKDKQ